MKEMFSKVMMVLVLSLFVGCGSSGSDSTISGTDLQLGMVGNASSANNLPLATTGNLVFQFTQAQISVPQSTTKLQFRFLSASDELLLTTEAMYNSTLTIDDVPVAVVKVEIRALDTQGFPVATFSDTVSVEPGETTIVEITNGAVEQILFTSLTTNVNTLELIDSQTETLLVTANFSDGSTVENPAGVNFSSLNNAIVSVSENGVVSATDGGTTAVEASLSLNGVTQSVNVPVSANVLKLSVQGLPEIFSFGFGEGASFDPLIATLTKASGESIEINTQTPNASFVFEPDVPGAMVESFGPGNFIFLMGADSLEIGDVVTLQVTFSDVDTGLSHTATIDFTVVDGVF